MTIWPASGRSRISASIALTTSSDLVDEVEVVEDEDEAGRRLREIVEQQAREADALGAFGEPARAVGHEAGLAEARVEGVGQAGEQAARVAIGRLQGQPGHGGAAVARVGGGQRALAESRRRPPAESAVACGACAAPRAIARVAARAGPVRGHPTGAFPPALSNSMKRPRQVWRSRAPRRWLVAKLTRVVRPARVEEARRTSPSEPRELFGCDPTTGIVSVDADADGRARVWRRVGDRVERRAPRVSQLVSDHQPGPARAPARRAARAPTGCAQRTAAHAARAAGRGRARRPRAATTRTRTATWC